MLSIDGFEEGSDVEKAADADDNGDHCEDKQSDEEHGARTMACRAIEEACLKVGQTFLSALLIVLLS